MKLTLRPGEKLTLEVTRRGEGWALELVLVAGKRRISRGTIQAKSQWDLYSKVARFFADLIADEGLQRVDDAKRRE